MPLAYTEFAARVLACYAPPIRAASTLRGMRHALARLGEMPSVVTADDLTSVTLAEFVACRSRRVRANTLVGELGRLRAACSLAVAEGWLSRSPFASGRITVRPEPPARKPWHPIADVARLLDHLADRAGDSWEAHRLYALTATVAFTGLRRSEALYLRTSDVDRAAGLLHVVARRRLKTEAAAQPVPVPPGLDAVLAVWIPACGSAWLFPARNRKAPWTGGSRGYRPLDRLRQAGDAAGVPGVTWQSLRHSWATHAEGVWMLGEAAIQRVLRHTRPMTQRHYRHADADNLRRIGERVQFVTRAST